MRLVELDLTSEPLHTSTMSRWWWLYTFSTRLGMDLPMTMADGRQVTRSRCRPRAGLLCHLAATRSEYGFARWLCGDLRGNCGERGGDALLAVEVSAAFTACLCVGSCVAPFGCDVARGRAAEYAHRPAMSACRVAAIVGGPQVQHAWLLTERREDRINVLSRTMA